MEYVGNADEFPILGKWDFYNHAGVSPLPARAAEALRRYSLEAERGAYLGTEWYKDIERLRRAVATMIGAKREEIAFVKNTSEGIATVAGGIDWRAGDRIVTTAVEYPANVYPWMDVAKRFGVELVMLPEETGDDGARRVPLDRILEEAQHPRTRLVALSHVEFASGQRHDIAAVGRLCRETGRLFSVDAIQSVGALPVDVAAMGVDFLSADGHKWMLGPEGAGIFYCRAELLRRMRPLIVGWMNVVNADDYGHYDFTLKPDAGRFECGTHNVGGLLAMKASIELLMEVGLERVGGRIRTLTQHVIEGLQRKGYQVVSPRGEGEWSGIVSFASTKHDHMDIWKRLRKEHCIEIAVREGRLRVSPHFYNTQEQMDKLVGTLPGH